MESVALTSMQAADKNIIAIPPKTYLSEGCVPVLASGEGGISV